MINQSLFIGQLFEFFDLKEEEVSNKIKIYKIKEIEVKNLYYKYTSSREYVLKNINLHINKNEKIAIFGMNGSGDSDIMMTDTINPLKSKFKGFHKTFKQDDLGLSLSSFLLN